MKAANLMNTDHHTQPNIGHSSGLQNKGAARSSNKPTLHPGPLSKNSYPTGPEHPSRSVCGTSNKLHHGTPRSRKEHRPQKPDTRYEPQGNNQPTANKPSTGRNRCTDPETTLSGHPSRQQPPPPETQNQHSQGGNTAYIPPRSPPAARRRMGKKHANATNPAPISKIPNPPNQRATPTRIFSQNRGKNLDMGI